MAPGDGALRLPGRPRLVALAPAAGAGGIDVQAPIALWFDESVNLATVNTLSVQVRVQGGAGSIAYGAAGFCGDRLVVLTPSAPLLTDTVYEVWLTSALTDLEGERLLPPGRNGRAGTFRTAAAAAGVPPRVLGSFPPDGAVEEPNDHPVVLLFSKKIDFTSVSGAVDLLADGAPAAYGVPESHSGDRVVVFPHVDDDLDLGAALTLDVDTTITDTEFTPLPLAEPWHAAWTTLALARPSGIDLAAAPAVNLGNLTAFPTGVQVGGSALPSDRAGLEIWEAAGADHVAAELPAVAGPGTIAFTTDLGDGAGGPLLADGPLVVGAWLERDGRRTTLRVASTLFQDTVRPRLVEFGPPTASIPSRFSTDLPELRPYGLASETISAVEVEVPPNPSATRTTALPSPDRFFLGGAFPVGQVAEGPFPFSVRLTDAAGNPMLDPVAGSAVFRGFVGPDPAVGGLTVVAFDQRTLQPVAGATVFVEDFGGAPANEDAGTTGSGGAVVFDDAVLPGARTGPQTVTIIHPSYHAVTVAGVDASFLSVPLREKTPPVKTVSPAVSGVAGGTGRFVSPLLAGAGNVPDPDAATDLELPIGFGSIQILPDRPGWFAAFHDVADYGGDPVTGRYFDLFAVDPRILLDAAGGSSGSSPTPLLEMTPSSLAGTVSSDWIYPLTLAFGAGFDPPVGRSSVAAGARIPGMLGLALTGTGSISGSLAAVELEQALQALAVAEGAPAGQTVLQFWAEDADGDQALRRIEVAAVAAPPPALLTLLDIALPLGPNGDQTWPAVSLSFDDTLGGSGDWYRLVLTDNDLTPDEWEIWLPAAATSGSLDLPALRAAPGADPAAPPLLTDPGNAWTLTVETFALAPGTAVNGIFFRQLFRDAYGWTRSTPGAPFSVLLP
ncbi:MAG: hypothetical protein D6702_08895 [Planctomycetota bacterium]|nr:MAG: hypothetical protein D6702_08895 [Planctomycetota bacterium]